MALRMVLVRSNDSAILAQVLVTDVPRVGESIAHPPLAGRPQHLMTVKHVVWHLLQRPQLSDDPQGLTSTYWQPHAAPYVEVHV